MEQQGSTSRQDVLGAIVGEEHAISVALVLSVVRAMPREVLSDAIHRVDRAETIGPMVDPSAWLGGDRFRNAAEYKRVLAALLGLRDALESTK